MPNDKATSLNMMSKRSGAMVRQIVTFRGAQQCGIALWNGEPPLDYSNRIFRYESAREYAVLP